MYLLVAELRAALRHLRRLAAERVELTPPARDTQQLYVAQTLRQRRIHRQQVLHRLQAEHGAQDQQRSAGRPGLRATGRWVLDRVLRLGPGTAAERLRQAAVEVA